MKRSKTNGACCRTCGALQETADAAYAALYDAPESALAQVRAAAKRLDELCRIDASLAGLREQLQSAELAIKEASYGLRDYLSGLEANPGRLEEIENRLALLDKLKRKYGAVHRRGAGVSGGGARADRAGGARRRAHGRTAERARAPGGRVYASGGRTDGAAHARRAQARKRRGGGTRVAGHGAYRNFVSRWRRRRGRRAGADRVEFLVSPNLGEEPKALEKVASGGEISRIALALKTCLAAPRRAADAVPLRTLVFDEVDAGIGGSAAEGVGRRLKKLAAANQVLCVTHLAQIAAFADHHYCVEKHESNGRTVAGIEELDAAGPHARGGAHAIGAEADARGIEARRAIDSERGFVGQASWPVPLALGELRAASFARLGQARRPVRTLIGDDPIACVVERGGLQRSLVGTLAFLQQQEQIVQNGQAIPEIRMPQ